MGKKNKNQTNNDLPFHDDDCDCDESKIDWKGYTIKGSDNTEYLIIKLLSVSGSVSTIWLAYAINNIKIKSYNDFYAIKIHFTTECDEGNKEIKVSELLKQKIKNKNIILPVDSFILTHPISKSISKSKSKSKSKSNLSLNQTKKQNVCIVMRLMACNLFSLLRYPQYINGMPYKFIRTIISQISETIKELHDNNIIHGDIKLENILLKGYTKNIEDIMKVVLSKSSKNAIVKYIASLNNTDCNSNDSYGNSDSDDDNDNNDSNDSNDDSDSDSDNDVNYSEENLSVDSRCEIDSDTDTDTNTDTDTDTDIDTDTDTNMNSHINQIDIKYIENPEVYLCDFGRSIIDNKKTRKYIQTQELRSPEVLLRLDNDKKSDLWAFGCAIYELLTGYPFIKFDDNCKNHSLKQLDIITNFIGPLPTNIINKSVYNEVFFTSDHKLKGKKNFTLTNNQSDHLLIIVDIIHQLFYGVL
jgi:serine/threonine protein kinase